MSAPMTDYINPQTFDFYFNCMLFLFLDLFWANNKMIWYEHLTLKSIFENYIITELYISGVHTRSPSFYLRSPMRHNLNTSDKLQDCHSQTPDGLNRIYA